MPNSGSHAAQGKRFHRGDTEGTGNKNQPRISDFRNSTVSQSIAEGPLHGYLKVVSRSLKAHILLVLVTLCWGSTFILIKNSLRDVSPLTFNLLRMSLATLALGAIYARRLRGMSRAALKAGAITGLWLFAGYEFQTTGIQFTSAAKSAFLTGVSVILVPVFLAILWRKRTSVWTWLGVLLAFAGLYLLTVPAGGLRSINAGDLLTLGCAVGFALQIIYLGRATQRHPFAQVAFLQTATAAVLMACVTPALEHPHIHLTPLLWTGVLVTGLINTAVAFTIQAWAQQFLPATHTALIFSLEPVFAWITSFLVAGEVLGWRAGSGAALILAGIVLAETKGHAEDGAAAAKISPATLDSASQSTEV
jgi:drug/metabolite transporter (DMT)-like permease